MHFKVIAAFTALFIRLTWAGALQIIDQDGECLIWSNDNYGYTGYSESFAKLNRDDYLSEFFQMLSIFCSLLITLQKLLRRYIEREETPLLPV